MCHVILQTSGPLTRPSSCIAWQVMNEVALHRGASPHLNTIDAFVDGQHLTEAVVRTFSPIYRSPTITPPTVRWSYRVNTDWFDCLFSFRGRPYRASIFERDRPHANMPTESLIPAFSLSCIVFHYLACTFSLLLSGPVVFICLTQIGDRSRAPASVSMDGQISRVLHPGESVTVRASLHPIPCINRSSIADPLEEHEGAGPGKEDDWVRDINNLLQYNATFRSKALTRHNRS